MPRSIVLVHGAWHGAWTWDRVLPGLEVAGIPSIALDLPGHGEDTGLFGDLHADAARVGEVLDGLTGEVVLVGHSYGGAVITEAGVHPAVRHLVYIAAFALEVGQSCVSTAADVPSGVISYDGRPNLGTGFIARPGDLIDIDPATAQECLYNECAAADVQWAVARLGLQPLVTLQQEATQAAWQTTDATYVVCEQDLAVHPDLQRIMARRCGSVVEWPTDHSPFLCRPELVTELLVDLARA